MTRRTASGDFIGVISAEPNPPGIDHERWIDLILDHSNLVIPESREVTNPFTRQPMIVSPRPDVAIVIVDGEGVGMMEWSQTGDNTISVSGDRGLVATLAQEVAETLGAHFESIDVMS